ncbi:LiaF domain-containing protein [Daejeonella sp. H1SJ63]|jgi:predicted membrane protein|uniref:LiaF transmembrane domain-containing protein n=1 Tax=Daejeonella sp. H1SJ63 TaxID=3034145 RepID=UPI0023EDBFAD|nr:LiaF domain-containing protein [Daejeonella sp. H1SJ63]
MQNFRSSNQKSGKALVGLVLLGLGFILLLKSLDLYFIPGWLFSWPVFLILIGIFIGSRQGYNRPSAFMPLAIGVMFLSNKIVPDMELSRFFWPFLIIGIGAYLIFGRKRTPEADSPVWEKRVDPDFQSESTNNGPEAGFSSNNFSGDRVESTSVFGGIKKNIVSKNFQGGEIVNFFGGSEINLMQADIKGIVKLEVVQVFGGTKIIVPANWTVQSEMVAIFGGIEDKRPPQLNPFPDKVLVIEGTSIFGGIDIKSF